MHSREVWKKFLLTLPDAAFFGLARHYLGELKTPFTKHRVIVDEENLAISIGQQFSGLPEGWIPVVYTPVVSPRVADILRQQGIGYADRAGNCFLRSLPHRLLVAAKRGQTPIQI